MKRKENPNVHLIRGKCGCGTMFSFEISKCPSDEVEGEYYNQVYLICGNCATLTGLDEIATERSKSHV